MTHPPLLGDKANLAVKFGSIDGQWQPRIVAELNGQHVKLAKVLGEFPWHHHEAEDELFFVVAGRLLLRFRDREVWLEPGELMVVPRGVEHAPFAEVETQIVLFEPVGTVNTGTETSGRTFAPKWV
jgi:mannose-6-phosphate isomerase-like protein (cupin superfamily)